MVPQEKKEELLADLVRRYIFIKHMFSISVHKKLQFSKMQEERKIQHSLHINNVQELIEKEKVAIGLKMQNSKSLFRSQQHQRDGR